MFLESAPSKALKRRVFHSLWISRADHDSYHWGKVVMHNHAADGTGKWKYIEEAMLPEEKTARKVWEAQLQIRRYQRWNTYQEN